MKKKLALFKLSFMAALIGVAVTACQTKRNQKNSSQIGHNYEHSTRFYKEIYLPLIEKNTRSDERYNGFHNRFQYHVTLLSRQVIKTQIEMKARDYNWSSYHTEGERETALAATSSQTAFFVSFFSPDKEIEDLTTAADSAWRVYLEVAGRRYRGRVEKVKEILPVLQKYFPYHNRWSRPFNVYFRLPAALVERSESLLVITGPIGESRAAFPPSSADFAE